MIDVHTSMLKMSLKDVKNTEDIYLDRCSDGVHNSITRIIKSQS